MIFVTSKDQHQPNLHLETCAGRVIIDSGTYERKSHTQQGMHYRHAGNNRINLFSWFLTSCFLPSSVSHHVTQPRLGTQGCMYVLPFIKSNSGLKKKCI